MQHLADALERPGLRAALGNLGWLLAERAARLVLGVVVGFFVARHLGPDRLGALSYALALTTLVSAVVSLGLDAVVRRDLLLAPARAAEILASAAGLRLAAGLTALALVLLAAALGAGGEPALLAILALTLLQPAFLLPEVWLHAHLQARFATWAQTGALAASAALRLGLIAAGAGVAAFAWALVAELTLAALGLALLARRVGCRWPLAAATRSEMRRLLAESWPLLFAGVAVAVYMKTDEIMLRHLVGPAAVGTYAAATRLTEIWYFIPTALASSLLPALLRARERPDAAYHARLQQYFDLNAAAAYALALPLALAAPALVRLAYGPAFGGSAAIVAVHIWACVFVFLGVARGQWLVNEGLQHFYLVSTLAGAALNVLLNFFLIPRWAGLGAAWATLASCAVAAWLASYGHAAVRPIAALQTRALLIPFRAWGYLRRP
jgi:PST family polysaccharide transporter